MTLLFKLNLKSNTLGNALICGCLLLKSFVWTQTDTSLFNKDHLQISLEELNNPTRLYPIYGTTDLHFRPSQLTQLRLAYSHHFTSQWSVVAEGGIGLQTISFGYLDLKPRALQNIMFMAGILGEYRLFLKPRWILSSMFGGGINGYGKEPFSSAKSIVNWNSSGTSNQEFSFVKGVYTGIQVALSAGFKMNYVLKNKNMLIFQARFNPQFSSTYSGNFSMQNGACVGSFKSGKNTLQFGVGYLFTRAGKNEAALDRASRLGESTKEAKRAVRREWRKIDPKAYQLEVSGGSFNTLTKERGGQDFFENRWTATAIWQASLEKGFGKNFYLKGMVFNANYAVQVRTNGSSAAWMRYPFRATSLAFGIGKRMILNNQYNLINVDAGVTLNYQFRDKGLNASSIGSGQFSATGDTVYMYNTQSYIDHHFFLGIFVGASKDFQLTRSFFLSLSYRLNIGLQVPYHMDIQFSNSTNKETPTKLELNGTSQAVLIGLKYVLPVKEK